MRFNLVSMVKRPRRASIDVPMIRSTQVQADDLARIYLAMLEPWNRAAEILREPYEWALHKALQTDSIEETGDTTDSIAAQINRLVLNLDPALRDFAFKTEAWHRRKWVRNILSAVSVDLETILSSNDVRETIAAFLKRNVSLVRDVNEQTRGRIADAVFRGFQRRAPAAEVAKEIAEAAGMARKRARRIASHQTVNLASALNDQRRRQAGIEEWIWRSSHKRHFRPEHQARDGKIYTDKTSPVDLPGTLPNCGCVAQAHLSLGG